MLPTKFCNGTTVTCDGLSQWGSQRLAEQGFNSMEILRNYYGQNIELVTDAPIQNIQTSYPGTPLRLGAVGDDVLFVQVALNRISRDYPAIPKINPTTGAFGEQTEAAVREFQRIFELTPDGVVGKATWYKLVSIYVGVQRLAELVSMGQTYYSYNAQYPGILREGSRGPFVELLQYMLTLLAEFDNALLPLTIDGIFGPSTTQAVRQYQSLVGLTPDGVVGEQTWDSIYDHSSQAYRALGQERLQAIARERRAVPAMASGEAMREQSEEVRMGQFPGQNLILGQRDEQRRREE